MFLIRAFELIAFNMIIEMVRFKYIILLNVYLLYHLFVPFSTLTAFFWIFLRFHFISFVSLIAVILCIGFLVLAVGV